jgi:hypothetical protein
MPAAVTHEGAAHSGVVLCFHGVSNLLEVLICDDDGLMNQWGYVCLIS